MWTRRRWLKHQLLATLGLSLSRLGKAALASTTDDNTLPGMPAEHDPHLQTWMGFGASKSIWGADLLTRVREDLALIANTISEFETMTMLVRPEEVSLAQKLLSDKVVITPSPMDDLWLRDTGPVFTQGEDGRTEAIDFNFNGWGEKQDYDQDRRVAKRIAALSGARHRRSELVLEGGGIEVDGLGQAVMTESCIVNSNRNPGWTRADIEAELSDLLGLAHVIWLPGIRDQDITDGHTDFYARYAPADSSGKTVVLASLDTDPASFDYKVTRTHLDILRESRDINDRPMTVEVLEHPYDIRETYLNDDFAAGYMGFYVCNGAVIAQEFGDREADEQARDTLARLFPDREVILLDVDGIAAGGGRIHCATQQEPFI